MVEYTLKINKISTPTDPNWATTIPTEYTNIKGRVYNIVKVENGGKTKYDKNGYWQANADLMGLINPFTNPISNKPVTETKIELVYKDIHGWEEESSEKMYFDFLATMCVKKMQERYKELYGVDIDISFIKSVEEKKVDDIPPTELSLKYILYVDAKASSNTTGVTKVTFEIYENVNGNVTLLSKVKDFTTFKIDNNNKISVLLSDIDNYVIGSIMDGSILLDKGGNNKLVEWLDKNKDKLPKDTKYVLDGYPVEEKKDIKTETKTAEQIELDAVAWEFPPLVVQGEFTFDVQEENHFNGVSFPFLKLEIIGVGEIKETKIDETVDETVDETIDEEIDEEYLEEESIAMLEMQFKVEALNALIEIAERKPQEESNDSGTNDSGTNSSSSPIAAGDDADFWSLIAICACEDSDAQGRADVAQSIYNRVLSNMFGGKKIKSVVTSNWQYEPAFMVPPNRGQIHSTWKAIKNKETAIAALIYTKNYTRAQAEAQLKDTYNQISNLTYQSKATTYVQQRTDFLGTGLGSSWILQATGDVQEKTNHSSTKPVRRNASDNIFANIVGPGSFKWGRKNKTAEVPNDLLTRFKGDIS